MNMACEIMFVDCLGDEKFPLPHPVPAHIVCRAPHMMFCLKKREELPIAMQSRHLVWYGKVSIHVQHWHVLVY